MTTTKTNYYTKIPNIFVQSNNNKPSILKLLNNNKSVAFLKVIQDRTSIRETSVFSIDFILSKCNLTYRTDTIKMVRRFLSSMVELNLIDLLGEDPNTLKTSKMIECKLNVFEMNKDGNKTGYFKLLDNEWDAIMNYQGESDRFNLLNVFCSIKSRMYYTDKPNLDRPQVAFPSYINICDSVDISEKSLSKYIDALKMDLDLIACGNAGDMVKDHIYITANNVYTLKSINNWKTELRNGIESFKTIYEGKGYTFIEGKGQQTINERRKITGRIKALEDIKSSKGLSEEQEERLKQAYQEKEQLLTPDISESDKEILKNASLRSNLLGEENLIRNIVNKENENSSLVRKVIRSNAADDKLTDVLQEIFEDKDPNENNSMTTINENQVPDSVLWARKMNTQSLKECSNEYSDAEDVYNRIDESVSSEFSIIDNNSSRSNRDDQGESNPTINEDPCKKSNSTISDNDDWGEPNPMTSNNNDDWGEIPYEKKVG